MSKTQNNIKSGDTVSVTRGEGTEATTWVGVVWLVKADGTVNVNWHSPMPAKTVDGDPTDYAVVA